MDDQDEDWWKSGPKDPWFGAILTSVEYYTTLGVAWGVVRVVLDDCANFRYFFSAGLVQ